MRITDLDETLTSVPLEGIEEAEAVAVPAHDVRESTACILVARRRELVVIVRVGSGNGQEPPGSARLSVPWSEVGIGPFGLSGRVPGGLLAGGDALEHLLTVAAGDHLYQARVRGDRGHEAVFAFASAAHRAGARDYEP